MKAFTEPVQEEVKDVNDALIVHANSTESSKLTSAAVNEVDDGTPQ